MDTNAVIATLQANESALRRRGVTRIAVFGSTARGEATRESDLDLMVEIDPAAHVDVYGYVGITQFISALFHGRVDVADRDALSAAVRGTAERDAIYAF